MAGNLLMAPVILAAAAGMGALALVMHRVRVRRRMALEAVAQQAGWSFAGHTIEPEQLGIGALPLFSRGRRRRACNVMRGSDGPSGIAAFDYRYTVGGGNHQRAVVQTVVRVRSARLALPAFALTPERMFHKIGGLFGFHDIDFESSPEFSRRYLLRGAGHEARVRDVFTPVVRAFFEHRPPVSVEGANDTLVVYRAGRSVKPEDLRAFVEDALAIARQLERT